MDVEQQRLIDKCGEGDVFGSFGLMKGGAGIYEAKAVEPTVCALLKGVRFQRLFDQNEEFASYFNQDLKQYVNRLGSQLDDVMDHLEAVGSLLYLYGLTQLPSLPREMHELVNVLDQQAKLTADAMPRLKALKTLEDYWIECNRLENDGDQAYRMLLVRLFSGEYDALTVLKMKEVADELEAACDAFEHVANTVETIAVKES